MVQCRIEGCVADLIYKDVGVQGRNHKPPLQRFAHMPATSTRIGEGDAGKKGSVLKSKEFNIPFTLGKLPSRGPMGVQILKPAVKDRACCS